MTLVIVTDTKESFVPDLLAYIASQMPSLMEQGVSGYNIMTKDMQNPIQEPGLPDRIAGLVGSCIMQDIDGSQVITEAFNPINETIQQRWPNKVQFYTIIEQFDSFLGWFDKNYDMYSAGGSAYLVSRLLDGEALTGDSEALRNALQEVLSSGSKGSLAAYMVAGKGVQEAVPRGGGNAVNPAWRTAYVHACELLHHLLTDDTFLTHDTTISEWRNFCTAQQHRRGQSESRFREELPASARSNTWRRRIHKRGTSYISYFGLSESYQIADTNNSPQAFPFEKDYQQTFWGSNYARLLQIKRQVDPTDVFWCSPCVGNERWEVRQDGQLCQK